MKKPFLVFTPFLLIFLAFSLLLQGGASADASQQTSGSKQPQVIDGRDMTYLSEMGPYANTSQIKDWTVRIYPLDLERLDDALFKDSYVQVYVSDVKDIIQPSINENGTVVRAIRVYVPSDSVVNQLSEIPHNVFYVSRHTPSILMVVTKEGLQQIANNPAVYCIRVLPQTCELLGLTIDEARSYDNIAYTMNNHVGTVNTNTKIAAIDTGYDPAEYSALGNCAEDNIVYRHDFDFGDDDVTDGDNGHGTSVLDLMARAFGDTGEGDEMYDDPGVYSVLKASTSTAKVQAIEYCIDHSIDIVCMAFAIPYSHIWCNLFKQGTQMGITWVAGTGNDYLTNSVRYPASSHYVVAAGAYNQINGQDEAEKASFSNYGTVNYSSCQTCLDGCGQQTEFKPNIYECGVFTNPNLSGTSYSTPMACADIAIGFYSTGEYTAGYDVLLQTLSLCHTYPVVPSASSLQGDVIDTYLLWQYRNDLKVASYHLNENQGSTAADSSPYDNDGTIYGASWTTGVSGSALSFDGENDYMIVDHDSSLNFGTGSLTFEAWIKWDGLIGGDYDRLAVKSDYPNSWWVIDIAPDGSIEFESNIGIVTWGGGALLDEDVWVHLAIVVDRENNMFYLYKNGEEHDSQSKSWGGAPDSTSNMIFAPNADFDGILDEVCIYDRVLSPAEIEDNYEALLPHHQLTVICWDEIYQQQISGTISINDGEYSDQYGYLSVSLPEKEHKIQTGCEYYYFQYYDDGSTQYTENPLWITVTSDITIYAVFRTGK